MRLQAAPLTLVATGLAGLGRHGRELLALSVFVGIAVPPLAAFAKPVFTAALFALLLLAFLRVEPQSLRKHVTRPLLIGAATAWIMIAVPLVCGGLFHLVGLADSMPPIVTALTLQAMAPPLVSAPALAALMGLDAALPLATLIACMIIAPVSAAAFAALFFGGTVALTPLALGGKTLAMLAGAALLAALIRRFVGAPTVARHASEIDGLNVIALFVFAVSIMDGVQAHALAAPLAALALVALAFAAASVLGLTTWLVFLRAGRTNAFALALTAALRNLGLMAAAGGSAVPDLAWLYLAYAQLPIYLAPQIARWVAPTSPDADSNKAKT